MIGWRSGEDQNARARCSIKTPKKGKVRDMDGSGEDQMRVKSQKYSELNIDGRETCIML